jgi:Putative Actinobacterial Holin-X, holin superfamily III
MMQDDKPDIQGPLANASTGELVGRLADQSKELVKKEVDLAKAELRTEVKSEIKLGLGFAAAGFLAFIAFELLLAALVLGLAETMPGWAAALVVGGGVLAVGLVAALVGWGYRVRHPIPKTRKTLKEDAQWVQQGLG